ncbi:MAG TPA: dihydroneopterin aldolase [Polyangiaceae bacterium]|nr:dihydroneopterin aldolase [Polyangiaceae bacterium]
MDLIRIEGLELRCIVGVRSYERHREQPVRVELALGLDLSASARSGRIADTVDYSRVADGITALLRFREYRLLEMAAEEAAAWLIASSPLLQQVRVRLDKPEALAGRARSAAVEITRSRGAFGTSAEATDYGSRVEVLRSAEATIEAHWLRPGSKVRFDEPARRFEWISGGITRVQPSQPGPLVRAPGESSEYQADGSEAGLLVRCVLRADSEPRASSEAGAT